MTHVGDGGVDLVCMTTTQKQPRTAGASRGSSSRTRAAKVPAQRERSTAKAESRATEPSRRYHLDTLIKDLTPSERAERGRQIRADVPRSSHAEFDASARQRDPVEVLIGQCADRVPDLIPIRYGRMLASPFAYFRGAALPMANDLATTPVTGLAVQACGDAHVGNFGLFGSAERRLVFDINDFDETLPGPWEWDVKRLAASLEIAARDNGIKPRTRKSIVQAAVRRYRLAMARFASQPNLAVWYASADPDEVSQRLVQRIARPAARGAGQGHGEGQHERQHERARQADQDRQRQAADRRRPAAGGSAV